MEEEIENVPSMNSYEGEEAEDELETQVILNDVVSHHDIVNRNDDTELPFPCKSDSLALLSVYRYARKIKSFLGWENILEECELEESDKNSESENLCLRKESCSSHDEPSNSFKEGDNELLNENKIFSENSKEKNCDDNRHNSQDSDEISGHRSFIYLNDKFDQHGNDSGEGNGNAKNIAQEKTFRSEVKIIVEDWRNTKIIFPMNNESINSATENSLSSIDGVMNKSLIQESEAINAGFDLGNVDSILQDEAHVDESSSHETECSNTTHECVKFGEDIPKNVDGCDNCDANITEKCARDTREGFKSENDLHKRDSETEKDKERFTLDKDKLDRHLQEEALQNNVDNGETDKNVESNDNTCNEQHNTDKSEHLRNSLVNNIDKLVGDNVKEKHANNTIKSKNDRTLKAHIQFENEITKQPVFKDKVCSENQNLNRKDNTFSEDTECGFSIFRPRWLQPYATVKIYVILYSIIGVLHGSYYSYLIGTLSTLEKRYAFKSKISGAIMVADEVTPLLVGVIIGYYAGKANRPRIIALGMLLSAGCCLCSSLPYFIYGSARDTTVHNIQTLIGPKICDRESENGSCDLETRPPTLPAVLCLVVGSFLKGFGNLAYYAIGLTYLDDNSKKKTTPIYLAIALALRLLGPLFGFLMSSAFLKLYENPTVDPGYGSDDPRWIGAWWIGFFLQGILLFIFTLPIALFPRRLPGQRSVETNTAPASQDGLKQIFVGLLSALKRLGTNPVFILLIVNTNMKIFGHFGHSIMLPKYMENQFRLSASEASLYSGATSITFVMLSTILGGYLIWKFRPRIKVLLAGMIASEIILSVGFLILIIPRCQIVDMVNFGMSNDGLILDSACNQKCECSTTSYTPFCGPEGTTYFSPCYAGCTQELVTSSMSYMHHKKFRNCSCVAFPTNRSMVSTISEGICPDEKCWSQAIIYLVIYFFLLSISNAFTVAHSMILLRSVHPNDKSIALGTFETFICLFGFIPFPVTFGALVDSACLVWEKSCGEIGNCWFYDMKKYSYLLHGVGALFCSFSVMCLIGLYFLSSRVRDLYVDEDVEKEYVDIKLDTVSGTVTKL